MLCHSASPVLFLVFILLLNSKFTLTYSETMAKQSSLLFLLYLKMPENILWFLSEHLLRQLRCDSSSAQIIPSEKFKNYSVVVSQESHWDSVWSCLQFVNLRHLITLNFPYPNVLFFSKHAFSLYLNPTKYIWVLYRSYYLSITLASITFQLIISGKKDNFSIFF